MTPEQFKQLYARAKAGDIMAQYDLGVAYQKGDGVKRDDKRAVKWWEKIAEQHGIAAYNLAVCYQHGVGVKRRPDRMIRYYELAVSMKFAPAMYNLGGCYLVGDGVQKDPKKAVQLWSQAADMGFLEAQRRLDLIANQVRRGEFPRAD